MPPSEVEKIRRSSFTDAAMNCKDTLNITNGKSKGIELLDTSPPRHGADQKTKALPVQTKQHDHSQVSSGGLEKSATASSASARGNHQAIKRGSLTLKQVSGLGDIVEFDNSDLDDSDEEDDARTKPGTGQTNAVGGPNHRPLVGGFAAAAYEAARAHHYSNMNIKTENKTRKPARRDPRMA